MEGLYARDKYENNCTDLRFFGITKEKRQRELREKRPFFITGAVLIISLLSVCFFLYFGDRVVKAQESANDIQYKVVEIKNGDSLWSIAKENMDNTNDSGFINIYQYIHEIKRCNNMKSNQINAGCYLMVPYYN